MQNQSIHSLRKKLETTRGRALDTSATYIHSETHTQTKYGGGHKKLFLVPSCCCRRPLLFTPVVTIREPIVPVTLQSL